MNPDCETRGAISLRPVQDDDELFLLQVFASTREPEQRSVKWEADEWEAFIQLQYRAQKAHYIAHFPTSEHHIILFDAEPVGRIWIRHAVDEIRLIDIAILPRQRNHGIGTHLIRSLQDDARTACVPLRHSVELENPRARKLYERLGFAAIKTRGLHTLMEWTSDDGTATKK